MRFFVRAVVLAVLCGSSLVYAMEQAAPLGADQILEELAQIANGAASQVAVGDIGTQVSRDTEQSLLKKAGLLGCIGAPHAIPTYAAGPSFCCVVVTPEEHSVCLVRLDKLSFIITNGSSVERGDSTGLMVGADQDFVTALFTGSALMSKKMPKLPKDCDHFLIVMLASDDLGMGYYYEAKAKALAEKAKRKGKTVYLARVGNLEAVERVLGMVCTKYMRHQMLSYEDNVLWAGYGFPAGRRQKTSGCVVN